MPQLVAQLDAGYMQRAAFSPDGRRVVTVGEEITIWDLETGLVLRRFGGRGLDGVAFSQAGDLVAAAGEAGIVVFEIDTGLSRAVTAIPYPGVATLEFSADDRAVCIGSEVGVARWDIDRRTRWFMLGGNLADMEGPTVAAWPQDPTSVCLAANGTRALAACTDGFLRLWDIGSSDGRDGIYEENLIVSLPTGGTDCRPVMSRDGQLFGFVSAGARVRVWRTDGSPVADFVIPDEASNRDPADRLLDLSGAMELSPSGHLLVSGMRATVFDLLGGGAMRRISDRVLAIDRDAGFAVVEADIGGGPRVVRLEDGATYRQLRGYVSQLNELAISRTGRYLAVGGMGAAVHVWDLELGEVVAHRRFKHPVSALDISADGGRLAATHGVSENAVTVVWERGVARDLLRVRAHGFARLLPDGESLVVGGTILKDEIPAVMRYDVSSGRVTASYPADRDDVAIEDLALSGDGKRLVASLPGIYDDEGGLALVWDVATGKELFRLDRRSGRVFLDEMGEHLFLGSFDDPGAEVWRLARPARLRDLAGNQACCSPDGTLWATAADNGVRLRRANAREVRAILSVHERSIADLAFSPDGRLLFSAGRDGVVSITDVVGNRVIARLLSLDDGGWAVLDPSGRFDASNGGDARGLHWVVGTDILELSQLKNGYYLPGLLPALLGDEVDELGEVASLADAAVPLPPDVEMPAEIGAQFEVVVKNRGGGIGPVAVRVNGRELTADARPDGCDPDAAELRLRVDLTRSPQYRAGLANDVEVVPTTARGGLLGRGGRRRVRGARRPSGTRQRLFAVVAGVSDYAGADIRLKFAAKDARDFGAAITRAAERMFGPDNVDVAILPDGDRKTTGDNLRGALEDVAQKATGDDTVLLYLAGHGVAEKDEYFFMTREATELSMPPVGAARLRVALSGDELTQWLKKLEALKAVLILDTCNSGQLAAGLGRARGGSAGRMRALQRLRDRTAVFVLAGSAADMPSYESNSYGQGLLTYALLRSMRNADVLREGTFVDVQELFGHVQDLVPRLAKGQGGAQRPQLAMPRGVVAGSDRTVGSFDIGRLLEEDRNAIPLAQERALVMRTDFENAARQDELRFSAKVDAAMRDYSSGARARFRFADGADVAGAYRVTGTYEVRGESVELRMFIYGPGGKLATAEPVAVAGAVGKLDGLVKDVLRQVIAAVPK